MAERNGAGIPLRYNRLRAISCIISFVVSGPAEQAIVFRIQFGDGVQLIIPIRLTLCSIAISIIAGVLSGLYPDWNAMKMSPLEAE